MIDDNSVTHHIEFIKPHYVYVLADPNKNNEVFYVGKGTAMRGYDHLKEALKSDAPNSPKISRIIAIRDQGSEPLVRVIARFDTEDVAFGVESILIHWVYGYNNLTNEQPGHGSRQVRPRELGLIPELPGIDIPRRIKLIGSMKTGYLQDKIDNHARLNHAEMMQDLYDYLAGQRLPIDKGGVIALESGRYLAISIRVNSMVKLVLQITDSDKHSIIPNLRPNSDRKDDRQQFAEFLRSTLQIESKLNGRYAKLDSWQHLRITVDEHSKIQKLIERTIDLFCVRISDEHQQNL